MNTTQTPRRAFPLRLATSLKQMATALAIKDGVSLNHFISLAVAEKISRMQKAPDTPEQTRGVPKHLRENHLPPVEKPRN